MSCIYHDPHILLFCCCYCCNYCQNIISSLPNRSLKRNYLCYQIKATKQCVRVWACVCMCIGVFVCVLVFVCMSVFVYKKISSPTLLEILYGQPLRTISGAHALNK